MVMVKLNGGLGNQMFQYALYSKMQIKNKGLVLDTIQIKAEMDAKGRGTIFEAFLLDKDYNKKNSGVIRFIKKCKRKYCKTIEGFIKESEVGKFDPHILMVKKGYIEGYWQSYKYFSDIRDLLLERFKFKPKLSSENMIIKQKIEENEGSVSIHIRLGDYVSDPQIERIYGGICTPDYYKGAINFICQKIDNPTFYVFSNNPAEASKMLENVNYTIVDVNDERNAWADLLLMKSCKHNIIANSTFSWWGAWLNENENKCVIAPKRFINGKEMPDICPKEWVRL